MKRHFIIASHSRLASGMADTIRFFAGDVVELTSLDAYLDNRPIEEQVKRLVEAVPEDDETLIFTDILSGSVNQKFMPYVARPHTHLIPYSSKIRLINLICFRYGSNRKCISSFFTFTLLMAMALIPMDAIKRA